MAIETVQYGFSVEDFGLEATYPKMFTIPVLQGRLPPNVPVTLFTEHSVSDEIIESVSPDAAKIIEKDRRRPGYRKKYVYGFLYSPFMEALTQNFGTGIVNAHWVRSTATGQLTIGLYWASTDFPERISDFRNDPDKTTDRIKRNIVTAVETVRTMGFEDQTGVIGLGALTGTKPYARYFRNLSDFPLTTTGNRLTGAAVAEAAIEAAAGWRKMYGREPTVGIVGATGSTGMIVTAALRNGPCKRLILAATEASRGGLPYLAKQIDSAISVQTIADDNSATIVASQANIIVFLVGATDVNVSPETYLPGSIVIDAARPRVNQRQLPLLRPDIVVDDGPTCLVKQGGLWNYQLHRHRRKEFLWCMGNTIAAALSGQRTNLIPPLNPFACNLKEEQRITTEMYAAAHTHGLYRSPEWQWHGRLFSLQDELARVQK